MQKDVAEYVRKCEQCQKHAPLIHQPASCLNLVSNPWPFAQWGLDILDPFPRAMGNRRFVLVAVDYFTKWVEAEALANIWDIDVKKFVWRNKVMRFGCWTLSYLIMGCSLIVKPFASFAVILVSRTNIPPRPTFRATARLKPLTKRLWTDWRKDWMVRRASGPRSCGMFYGHTEQPLEGPREKLHSP